ncbi:hypothetical protein AB3R30_19890 [Leptolyngbyaceae cyanobacterium UHCC 1019]
MDFSRPGQAKQIWQQLQIEQYWEHHDRPSGQRFLGSIQISKQDSDQLLDITARNLSCVEPLTFDRLSDLFDTHDSQRYWIRIITLALSEYAYYNEGDAGFWQGVCDRLNLPRTQGVQSAFRSVLDQGFQLWGLVTTQQRNHYVSTLWLQSGIPQQNLRHFAQLLEELSGQYDWWDIAHADPEDLSQLLYELCQEYHPQWGKLITFLRSSCKDDDEEAAPIAGELLQGLAIVAQALERQGLQSTVLQDAHQREQLLQNFCLPNTFFLRNWDNLVRVLTPRGQNSTHRRNIISLRKKPLLLMLDIADSMDIQLVLPAQTLWKSDWRNLRGSYGQIQEQGWETTLPMDGALVIPELNLPISQISHEWIWHLRSHTNASLIEWRCEGTSPDFPVLFFDAWTGDRLIPPNGLKGKNEIICFYNRAAQLELSDGVELIDSFVPCSISGWRGQQLHLRSEQAQLTIRLTHSTKIVHWDNSQADYPQLRGLKLKRKDPVYLEVPSIWYPPVHLPKTISIQVEDLHKREVLTTPNEQVSLPAHSKWQQIVLAKWINRGGNYAVQLWSGSSHLRQSEAYRWYEKFELRSSFAVSQPSPILPIQVCDRENKPIATPIQVASTSEFWLEELALRDLWALEEVRFLLTNGQEAYRFVRQANSSGVLPFNLAALRDVLPESDRYSLSYQCQGQERHSLLEMSAEESVSHIWMQPTIHQLQASLSENNLNKEEPQRDNPPAPESFIYLVKVTDSSKRKAFHKLFVPALKRAKLEEKVVLIEDKLLRDLIRVKLRSLDDMSSLKAAINQLEQRLCTLVTVERWG